MCQTDPTGRERLVSHPRGTYRRGMTTADPWRTLALASCHRTWHASRGHLEVECDTDHDAYARDGDDDAAWEREGLLLTALRALPPVDVAIPAPLPEFRWIPTPWARVADLAADGWDTGPPDPGHRSSDVTHDLTAAPNAPGLVA